MKLSRARFICFILTLLIFYDAIYFSRFGGAAALRFPDSRKFFLNFYHSDISTAFPDLELLITFLLDKVVFQTLFLYPLLTGLFSLVHRKKG